MMARRDTKHALVDDKVSLFGSQGTKQYGIMIYPSLVYPHISKLHR